MAFEDLAEFFDPSLRLPIAGRTFVIPPPPASVGLRLQALEGMVSARRHGRPLTDRESTILDDDEERDFLRDSLGSAFDDMVAAAVPWPMIKHAGGTAFIAWTQGPKAAEEHWASVGKAQERSSTPQPTTSTGTGGESTTPTPVSTSGTTSRRRRSTASSEATAA